MHEHFQDWTPSAKHLRIVEWAADVTTKYLTDGYRLSLRQLYYQGVKINLYPNRDESYTLLGNIISKARRAGLIDWESIEDRERPGRYQTYRTSAKEIMQDAADSFKLDKWHNQKNHVIVMVEKKALEGVLIPVCDRLEVPFHANKGYSSDSALYDIGKRLQEQHVVHGKDLYVVYVGDHDPSGVDMPRDVADRLTMFSQCPVTVVRAALTYKQVKHYNPPNNPTKMSDTRAAAYVEQYGEHCWELDALDAPDLARIVERAVLKYRDEEQWERDVEKEDTIKEQIQSTIDGLGQ